jgi:hypothetical protein
MTAKSAPYPPCTVTVSWSIGTDSWRCIRRVTLTEPYRRAVIVHSETVTKTPIHLDERTITPQGK